MTTHPGNITAVFTHEPSTPVARLVHLALAAIADEHGHAETTVHTLEHMTGLIPIAIEAALGHNAINEPLFPAAIALRDGIVVADLAGAGV